MIVDGGLRASCGYAKKEMIFMPLTMARAGEECTVSRVSGKDEVRKHLESMGFVAGAIVTVISDIGGNLIVNVKETRVALDKSLAAKIFV